MSCSACHRRAALQGAGLERHKKYLKLELTRPNTQLRESAHDEIMHWFEGLGANAWRRPPNAAAYTEQILLQPARLRSPDYELHRAEL